MSQLGCLCVCFLVILCMYVCTQGYNQIGCDSKRVGLYSGSMDTGLLFVQERYECRKEFIWVQITFLLRFDMLVFQTIRRYNIVL